MDDDFRSSDGEFGEPINRYAGVALGKRSIKLMLENATEDRMSSKKASKLLPLTLANPRLEYYCELWHARLTAFRRDTLRVKKSVLHLLVLCLIERQRKGA